MKEFGGQYQQVRAIFSNFIIDGDWKFIGEKKLPNIFLMHCFLIKCKCFQFQVIGMDKKESQREVLLNFSIRDQAQLMKSLDLTFCFCGNILYKTFITFYKKYRRLKMPK